MIFGGINQVGFGLGQLIQAPFNIVGGLASTALGVATLPLRLAGSLASGLFGGMTSPAAMYGAQAGMMPFL